MLKLSLATWKYAKRWAYSITYDEALAELSRFVIPLHQELGLPGHVEVVAGQIGEIRNCAGSSFNGMRHMNADELRSLLSMGWGIGCHSWSHQRVTDDPERELKRARKTIEQAIGQPITVFVAPGTNDNLTEDVQASLPDCGYLAGFGITDDINQPDPGNMMFLSRVAIHERYRAPFFSAFDAHKRIRQAQLASGWLVDYCHCPLEQAVDEYKDCTAAHHRERLEAVMAEGGDECWHANLDEVVDYLWAKRCARIMPQQQEGHFHVALESLPEQVRRPELSFELEGAAEEMNIIVDGSEVQAMPMGAGRLCFTAPVGDGTEIVVARRQER